MKKWIVFLITAGITLYFIIMYESPETYRLLFAEMVWFVFSLLQLYYVRVNVQTELLDSVRVVNKGADIPIQINIKNKGVIPIPFAEIYIKVNGKRLTGHLCCSLKGKEQRSESLYTKADKAGLCRIEISRIVYYDILHIFDGYKKTAQMSSVFVLPRIYPVAMEIQSSFRYFGDDSGLYYEDEEGNDPSEVLEIREYRAGDRLQKIHWKLSQRIDTLMIKEYSEPIGFAVVFLLDTSRFFEAFLETFMSISMEMCQQKCLHYICYMDERGALIRKPIRREENLYLFLQFLMGADQERMKGNPKEKGMVKGRAAGIKNGKRTFKPYKTFNEEIYNDWYGRGSYHTCLRLTEKLELYKQEELIGQIDEQDVEKSLAEIMVML